MIGAVFPVLSHVAHTWWFELAAILATPVVIGLVFAFTPGLDHPRRRDDEPLDRGEDEDGPAPLLAA